MSTAELIEQLPDERSAMAFKVRKRICCADSGMQFLTSSYPNRSEDAKRFYAMDGIWEPDLLPDLRMDEADYKDDPRQGIEVDVYISRVHHRGWHEMWVYGFRNESRMITPYKPEKVRKGRDCTRAMIKNGSMYISSWCDRDYFPYMENGAVFPVYIKVERIAA